MNCSSLCLRCNSPQVHKANFCGFHGLCDKHYIESSICKCIHCTSIVPVLSKPIEKKCCICEKACKGQKSVCEHIICKECLEKDAVCPECVDSCDYCQEKNKIYKKCDFPHILCQKCLSENDNKCKICEDFAKTDKGLNECEYCLKASSVIASSCEHVICDDCFLKERTCPLCSKKNKLHKSIEIEKPTLKFIFNEEINQSLELEVKSDIKANEIISDKKTQIDHALSLETKNPSKLERDKSNLTEEVYIKTEEIPRKELRTEYTKRLDENYANESYSIPLHLSENNYLPQVKYSQVHKRKNSYDPETSNSILDEKPFNLNENEEFISIYRFIKFALILLNFCLLKPILFCLKIISCCNRLSCYLRNPDKGGYYFYCIFLCKCNRNMQKYWISIIKSNSCIKNEKGIV